MRCKACNSILSDEDLKRQCEDWDFCSLCRGKSMEEFDLSDREYTLGGLSCVQMDGTTLHVDDSYMSCEDDDF